MDFPHKSCPMGVKVDETLPLPPLVPHISVCLTSEDKGLLKLQVDEVKLIEFSISVVLSGSWVLDTKEPGIRLGS